MDQGTGGSNPDRDGGSSDRPVVVSALHTVDRRTLIVVTTLYWLVTIAALGTGLLIVFGLWVGKVPETVAKVLLGVWAVGLLTWAWWAPKAGPIPAGPQKGTQGPIRRRLERESGAVFPVCTDRTSTSEGRNCGL